MDYKKISKNFKYNLAYLGLNLSSLIVGLLNNKLRNVIAKYFADLGWFFAKKLRLIAIYNIKSAFRDKTNDEANFIAKSCFEYLAKSAWEMLAIIKKPQVVDSIIEIQGEENLKTALLKGKGVIALSAHFGNFPLLMTYFARRGYLVNCMMRRMRDERVNNYFEIRRNALAVKSIYTKPQDLCIKQSIEVLRKNEILFVQLDQHFGSSGAVTVNFFNQPAQTATGPIILSLRTDAIILPLFIVRRSDDTHSVIIEQPFILEKFDDYNKTLQVNIQRITEIIEKYIRQYPAEWGWIHRRWKK
ncbi:MAG: hypothetical protein AB1755_05315 [Candidatus Omnitrophota bacterium]